MEGFKIKMLYNHYFAQAGVSEEDILFGWDQTGI
jgi:hypothetical protein